VSKLSDTEIKSKAIRILCKELGKIDTIKFIAQTAAEKTDYLRFQKELFEGLDVEEIFNRASQHWISHKGRG